MVNFKLGRKKKEIKDEPGPADDDMGPRSESAKSFDRSFSKKTISRQFDISYAEVQDVPQRGYWAGKSEFLLSCMGYAIGISNVWRFPYLCYRSGGGAFLVPYLLMLVICGIPLFFMETSLGQFASTGCITIFDISPLFRGAGYGMVFVNLIVTMYYNVILAYSVVYFFESFRSKLPWMDCNNDWNTQFCVKFGDSAGNISIKDMKSPADEFFHNKVLQISQGIEYPGNLVWQVTLANLATWVIVYLCIMNGVKSVGKVVYFTATFPYVVLFILLIRGVTLPGASTGILYYIYPQWKELTNLKTWTDAAVQIFFSMGPGWGGILNMASYNQFRNNTRNDSIIVPAINGATSIFAGFVVFSVIGYMAQQTGLPVSEVATSGPGLAFVTYPEAIAMMPVPQLWAVLFFFMLFTLGLDSVFVQIESIVSSIADFYPPWRKYKKFLSLFWCILMFFGSLSCCTNGGMYVLSLLDWYCASITIIITCFCEVIILGWIYGIKNWMRDLEFMIGKKLSMFWAYLWKYIQPILLICILITTIVFNTRIKYGNVEYPDWSIVVGWLSCGLSLFWVPGYMIFKLIITPGSLITRWKRSTKHTKEWGPCKEEFRKAWMDLLKQEKIMKHEERVKKLNEKLKTETKV